MDKKTKVYINGVRDRKFEGNQYKKVGFFTRQYRKFINNVVVPVIVAIVWFVKWTVILGGAALFVAGFAEGYRLYMAHNLVPEVKAEEQVRIPKELQGIVDCESGIRLKNGKAVSGSATHYDTDGSVLERGNRDRSIDRGWGQINSIHNKEARRMGLDLNNEEDNKKFAVYLYETQGRLPWKSSSACWK